MSLPDISNGDDDGQNDESDQEKTDYDEFYWFSGESSEDDMDTLKRVRSRAGTHPGDDLNTISISEQNSGEFDTAEDSDVRDDMELANSISNRFPESLVTIEPLSFIGTPFDAEDEDDFEIFRAIQRRFSSYHEGVHGSQKDDDFQKCEQVRESNTLEEQSSISLYEGGLDDGDVWSPLNTIHPTKSSNIPDGAHTFFNAIKKNRSCQRFIRNKLIQLEANLEENKRLIERVKILKDYQRSCRRKVGRALSQKKDPRLQLIMSNNTGFSNISKTTAMKWGPQENAHVSNYRAALEKFPLSFVPRIWSQVECNNIGKGIKQQFQQMSFELLVELCGERGDSVDLDEFLESIANFDITPDHMHTFLPKVDWNQLASAHFSGRSGAECKSRWMNWENPLINHGKWGASEDRNLLQIVQNKGYSNWIDIASLLGTNRTPFQCLARFQRSLNSFIMRSDWRHEEDVQLAVAVETFGESKWQLVASTIDGRTGTQCSNRWYKTLHPMRKREGRWNLEEDKLLKVTVALMGPKSWNKIAEMVPGRTQAQCRERWVNCLDPSLNLNNWTEEEDFLLKSAIAEHGYCWSRISKCVPPRTDSQCRRRWKHLFPEEVPVLEAARKVKKIALVSNFVDRESERPALSHHDFIPLSVITASEPDPNIREKGKKSRVQKCTKKNKRKAEPLRCDYNSDQGTFPSGSSARSPRPKKTKIVQKSTKKNKRKAENFNGDYDLEQGTLPSGTFARSSEPKKTKLRVRKNANMNKSNVTACNDHDSDQRCLTLIDPAAPIIEFNKRKTSIGKSSKRNERKANTSGNDYDSGLQCLSLIDRITQIPEPGKRKIRVRRSTKLNGRKFASCNDYDLEQKCLSLFDPVSQIPDPKKRKTRIQNITKNIERKASYGKDCDSEQQCLVSFDPVARIPEPKKRRYVRKDAKINNRKDNNFCNDCAAQHTCLVLFDPSTQISEPNKRKKPIRKRAKVNEMKSNTYGKEYDSQQQALVLFDPAAAQFPEIKKRKRCVRKSTKMNERKSNNFGNDNDAQQKCLVVLDPSTQTPQSCKRKRPVPKSAKINERKPNTYCKEKSLDLFDPASTQFPELKKRKRSVRKSTKINERKANNFGNGNDVQQKFLVVFDPSTQIPEQCKRKRCVRKRAKINERKANDCGNHNDTLDSFYPSTQIPEQDKRNT